MVAEARCFHLLSKGRRGSETTLLTEQGRTVLSTSSMLRFRFASLLIAAATFFFVNECIAGQNDHEASSSASAWRPHVPEGPIYTIPQPITMHKYFKQLDPKRIGQLNLDILDDARISMFQGVPFYGKTPIFDVGAPVNVVERALKDFESVLLVDPITEKVRLITYEPGRLQKEPFDDEADTVLLFRSLDPNVHILHRHFFPVDIALTIKTKMPGRVEIDYLPHNERVPILTPGYDSLGHMLSAANTGTFRFWHIRQGHEPVLIVPRSPMLARLANYNEDLELNTILTKYGALTQKYSPTIASLKHGAPITLDEDKGKYGYTMLLRYPRFGRKATRDQMIKALQENGRFRYYDSDPSSSGPIKVKVLNAPGTIPGTPMRVDIRPLSDTENAEEMLLEKLGRIHLPT